MERLTDDILLWSAVAAEGRPEVREPPEPSDAILERSKAVEILTAEAPDGVRSAALHPDFQIDHAALCANISKIREIEARLRGDITTITTDELKAWDTSVSATEIALEYMIEIHGERYGDIPETALRYFSHDYEDKSVESFGVFQGMPIILSLDRIQQTLSDLAKACEAMLKYLEAKSAELTKPASLFEAARRWFKFALGRSRE